MTLDQKTIATLRSALEKTKAHLEEELGRMAKPTETPGDYATRFPEDLGPDIDENAAEVEQYTDQLAVEQNLEAQLKDVRDALERFTKDTYGICEKCGKEIARERLEAYPAARTCVACA